MLYLIFNFIVLTPFLKIGFNNSFVECLEYLVILYLITYIFANFKRVKVTSIFLHYLLILILLLNLSYTQYNLGDAINEIRQLLLPFLFYYCVQFSDRYNFSYFLPKIALLICYIMGTIQFLLPNLVRGYYLTFSDPYIVKTNFVVFSQYNRILGIYNDPNVFGYFLVMILAIKIASTRKKTWLSYVLIFIDFLFILLSQSRWCILISVVLLIFYFVQMNKFSKVRFAVISIILLISLIFLYPNIVNIIITRFNKNISGDTNFTDPRFVHWAYYINDLRSVIPHLLFGKGLGATGMGNNYIIMENSYLDIMYKLGLIGVCVYYINIGILFIYKYKSKLYIVPLVAFCAGSIMADLHRIPSITIILFSFYSINKKIKNNE
ncbi:putative membrane protein [Paenibacillus riograndensis SBR5]|uniref:Putative membrane protein n=1 Tax=Paenibacillus riograndensis SBR5 TaxID=1073571 RepID=A0A0E4HD69_9BACL|nr:putative membrane protein [Paenibacillus riograndensis SBR5]